jgi:hypothetical protein
MRSLILPLALVTLLGCVVAGLVLALVDPSAAIGGDFFAAVAQVVPVLVLAIVLEEAFLHGRRVSYIRTALGRLRDLSQSMSDAASREEQRRKQLSQERNKLAEEVAKQRAAQALTDEEDQQWETFLEQLDSDLSDQASIGELHAVGEAAESFAKDVADEPAASASEAKQIVVSTLLLGAGGEIAALLALVGVSTVPLAPMCFASVGVLFVILGTDLIARFDELPEIAQWRPPGSSSVSESPAQLDSSRASPDTGT